MKKQYNIIIVGAGPAGYMCAYELIEKKPELSVLLVDKGHTIFDRKCPILEKKIQKCPTQKNGYIGCLPYCSITNGFGG
ncbi:MAG: FAD-dependent oxidoreductase, partial [Candidatus Izemoplasmatales bacterium]|nr:FAD-dependent oxidoreductase [Candidatus Izemoplasmatales bacterium]